MPYRRLLALGAVLGLTLLVVPITGAFDWRFSPSLTLTEEQLEEETAIAALLKAIRSVTGYTLAENSPSAAALPLADVPTPVKPQRMTRSSSSSQAMFWDFDQSGSVQTSNADFRRGGRESNHDPSIDVLVTSYLNGRVRLEFTPIDNTGAPKVTSVNFNNVELNGNSVFSGVSYMLDTDTQRTKSPNVNLAQGRYSVAVIADTLEPAVEGLATACVIVGSNVIQIGRDGQVQGNGAVATCGTPIFASNASVLQPGTLFSRCIAREYGGSLFEQMLEHTDMRESGGLGVELDCSGYSDPYDPGDERAPLVDVALWQYLVRLDVLSNLSLRGECVPDPEGPGLCSSITGTFGDADILALLQPYQVLFREEPSVFGPLITSPTSKLAAFDFSQNFLTTIEWAKMYRISRHDSYSVNDSMTTNDGGQHFYYYFGARFEVSDAARALLAGSQAALIYRNISGQETAYGFANEQSPILVDPIDVPPGTAQHSVFLSGVPASVSCRAPGWNLTNNEVNETTLNPWTYRDPLVVSCDVPGSEGRVSATLVTDQFGALLLTVQNLSNNSTQILEIDPYQFGGRYFVDLNLADGIYRFSIEDTDSRFDCATASNQFTVSGQMDIDLGLSQCTETERALSVRVNTTSYANGNVETVIPGTGRSSTAFFFRATVDADDIFDAAGNYILNNFSRFNRSEFNTLNLFAGTYPVELSVNLQAPMEGLSVECRMDADTITVSEGGENVISIRCGVPTKKLNTGTLQAAQASNETTVLTAPELFAVCLGNGGSDVIFGPPQSGGFVVSQIGAGVDFVEEILELQTLIDSQGAGIDLNCNGMGNVPFSGSTIDEPLWRYLVSLDVFRRLDLSGDLELITITDGSYGDDEIDSILAPYQDLIDAAAFPYGVLSNTPTQRLQFLGYSFNTFNNPAWSNLWRLSANDVYSVGDIRSTNNSGLIYSFAVQRDATASALARLQNGNPQPMMHLFSAGGEFGFDEGFAGQISLPLAETGGLSFGPFDVGDDPSSENIDVFFTNVPSNVMCSINGVAVENGVVVTVNGFDHTPYEGDQPIQVLCESRPNAMRLAATLAFPTEQGNLFPLFNGAVDVVVRDDSGLLVDESTLRVQSSDQRYFYEVTGLPDGNYTISFTPSSVANAPQHGCENGGRTEFTVAGGNVELGIIACSEAVSSLPGGLIQQCYTRAGIEFIHELRTYLPGGTLDCSNLRGSSDLELLEVVMAARTVDLRDNNLNTNQLETLSTFNFQLPEASALKRILLDGNPGVTGLDNNDFAGLLSNFEQVDAGSVIFPLGNGLMAQCLRRNNFASGNNALVLQTGDPLDCSGLRGTDDFDTMSTFLRNAVLFDSVWDFTDTGFNPALVESLTSNLFRQYPQIVLRGNTGIPALGNLTYVRLSRDFADIVLDTPEVFPRFTYIKPSDPQTGATFGRTAALSGDGNVLVVAAPGRDVPSAANLGAVYVFTRENNAWKQARRLIPPVVQANARYGDRVAVSTDGTYLAIARNLTISQSNVVDVYARTGPSTSR